MKLLLKVSMVFLLIFSVHAENQKDFTYDGQNGESFALETTKNETRYRPRQVDTTCTRQIPYTVNVCGDETRYRQECRTIPGRNVCRTVNDRQCRNVQRTRRVCRDVPGQRTCRTIPGRRVCRQQPGRRVCRDRNGRQVCSDIPGRQVCSTTPSRQQCSTGPSRRVCSDQPYTDRVCRNVPIQQCRWEPSRQDCRQVPYTVHVCRDVTRYRSEDYPCTRTIQEPYTITRDVKAELDFEFIDNLAMDGALAFISTKLVDDKLDIKVEDRTNGEALIYVAKKTDVNSEGDDEITINNKTKLTFVAKSDFVNPIKEGVKSLVLDGKKAIISLKKLNEFTEVVMDLKIKRHGFLGIGGVVFEQKLMVSGKNFNIQHNNEVSDLVVELPEDLKKGKKYKVNVKVKLQAKEGNLINPISEKLEFEKELKVKSEK